MSKRKHEALETDSENGERDAGLSVEVKRQRRHLAAAIEVGATQVFHALRFARGFERQKLGRRQKSAVRRQKGKAEKGEEEANDDSQAEEGAAGAAGAGAAGPDDTMARLELEVAELKKLQLAELAQTYLCRQLAKTKSIAEHEALPREVLRKAVEPLPTRDQAYVNVTSRLYKSNPVVKAMDRVMLDIRELLGLKEEEALVKKKKKKRMRKADYEAAAAATEGESAANGEESKATSKANGKESEITKGASGPRYDYNNDDNEHSDNEFHGFEDHDIIATDEDREEPLAENFHRADGSDEDEDESMNDSDLNQLDGRIASGSDSEDHSDEEEAFYAKLAAKNGNREIDMDSVSETGSSQREGSPPLRRVAAKQVVNSTRSAFLPSLNTGYISGSDSDASDASALAPPRKNRMGQRARRELWESKYGDKARHLQDGTRSVRDRDKGWDLKRGAQDGNRGAFGRDRGRRRGGWEGRGARGGSSSFSERPDRPRPAPKPQKEAKLPPKTPTYGKEHPSWTAKQMVKEKMSVLAKPAGKKITFD